MKTCNFIIPPSVDCLGAFPVYFESLVFSSPFDLLNEETFRQIFLCQET